MSEGSYGSVDGLLEVIGEGSEEGASLGFELGLDEGSKA